MPFRATDSPARGGENFSFDFAGSRRLKKGWEFDSVFRTGRQQRGELVRLYYVQKNPGAARVGATVGKRIAGAVGRSRGRRMLREALRRLLPWMKEGVWLVASLRETGLGVGARDIYRDTARSMRAARLLKGSWPGLDWSVDSCGSEHCPRRSQ